MKCLGETAGHEHICSALCTKEKVAFLQQGIKIDEDAQAKLIYSLELKERHL